MIHIYNYCVLSFPIYKKPLSWIKPNPDQYSGEGEFKCTEKWYCQRLFNSFPLEWRWNKEILSIRFKINLESIYSHNALRSVFLSDLEPPTSSFCPSEIVKEAKSHREKVSWDLPVCSDNSHLPPIIWSNRKLGDLFGAPGKYKIQHTVKDFDFKQPNIYTGCSFMITLKSKLRLLFIPERISLGCWS